MNTQQWSGKINRARYVERQIVRWIKKNFDKEAVLVEGYCPEWDIISPALGNVEVKEDRMAHQSENYAFEFQDGFGKPSGYAGTQAKFFVLVDWEHVAYVATESLKFLIDNCVYKKKIEMGDTVTKTGARSLGYLVPRNTVLNSPLVTVIDRWFPVLLESHVRTN